METARLSLNQITVERLSLKEAVDACRRHGIQNIGVWRHKLAEAGVQAGAQAIRDAGLRVSSLCRGGMFPAATAAERRARIDDNLRAIEEAAALGANLLVLVCGPAPDRDLPAARRMVEEGIGAIAGHARAAGVRLGIEPLHPMFAADRSVITSLREANALAARFDADTVGVVIDVFHVWWDHEVLQQIACARGRILGFHVSDWLTPLPDWLLGRGMMGDGVIDLRRLREAVEAAGYNGAIEIEIFNRAIWDSDSDEVLGRMIERFQSLV
jgi:sugar phosphate isomerase/epimerase